MRAFETTGISAEFYAHRKFELSDILPWQMIDCGVSKEFLMNEYKKAYEIKTTPDCGTKCSGCGAAKYGVPFCKEQRCKNKESEEIKA